MYGFLLESPQDPKTYLSNGEGNESASFWAWPETQGFLEKYGEKGMIMTQFDQGMFGHARKKPTGCMTNLPDMGELDGCRIGGCDSSLAENLDERLNKPNGLLVIVGSRFSKGYPNIHNDFVGLVWPGEPEVVKKPRGWNSGNNTSFRVINHTGETVGTCVINMAGAKPHRRRENPGCSAWTMSVDLIHLPIAKDLATKRVVKYGLISYSFWSLFFDEPPKMIDDDDGKDERRVDDDEIEAVDPVWGEGLNEDEYILQDEVREGPELDDPKSGGIRDLGDSDYEPEIFDEDEAIQLGLKGFQRDEKKTEHPWKRRLRKCQNL